MRIANLDAPSNIHRKPKAVILSHEREMKKYLQANAVTSLPLWFHVMEYLEMKPRYSSATKPCRKLRQEIRKVLFRNVNKLHEVEEKGEQALQLHVASHTPMFCIRRSRIPAMSRISQHSQRSLSQFYHLADSKQNERLYCYCIVEFKKSRHSEKLHDRLLSIYLSIWLASG